jgi:4-nitrophenyl phosphatase
MVALDKTPVGAVVLAAGESRRMGEPKQLLPVGGLPMVRRVTEAVCAAGLAQVVVVIGAQAEAVGQALAGLPVEQVLNERWPEGMTTSLHAGLRALRPEIRAALVVLADQPGLTAELIRAVVDCYHATGAPVVAPFYREQRGRPVLFDRALFPELLAAAGNKDRREVIARHQDQMARLEVSDPAVFRDIDTRQDYEKVAQLRPVDSIMARTDMNIDLLRDLHHLIVDMDGVLYRGKEAIPGTGAFLDFLREQGIGFLLATNNSTKTPGQYVDKLAEMGVSVRPGEILTSAQATADYLRNIAPRDTRVFVVGMDGLFSALREAGFALVEDNADYVVAGMDFNVCYERLSQATLQIRAGARFIGTNADRTFPSERGITPGAGALLALLETATGVTPTVIGKPGTALVEQALAHLGAHPSTTGMLGDRLDTDILAGRRAGLVTLLVLSGVTAADTLAGSEIQPDLVFRDVGHLHAVWKEIVGGGPHPAV